MNGSTEVKNAPPFWASNNNWHTYLLLHKHTNLDAFRKKFHQLSREKMAYTAQQMLGTSLTEFEKTGQFANITLQNLEDIHLRSDRAVELAPNGSIQQVWIFSAIAAFILMIACINFMNLATARSSGRAREVGVRKALGSRRTALIGQFLTESGLLTLISVILATLLAWAVLPWFRDLTGRELAMPWNSGLFWLGLTAMTILVSLLAGSYPAFFLSAFNAVRVLKGETTGLGQGKIFRSALVVFQFSASVVLIVATILVYHQLNYIQHKALGFNKNQVIILKDAYALGDNLEGFKTELLRHPAVEHGTVSGFLPVPSNRSDRGFWKERAVNATSTVSMQNWRVDADYLQTLGMELAEGRNFDAYSPVDSNAVLLNETAVRLFKFEGDPVGQKIYTKNNPARGQSSDDFIEYKVVGVVKDFHYSSLRSTIDALCLMRARSRYMMSFRINGESAQSVLTTMEKTWKAMAPGQPFEYEFLDDAFTAVYRSEQRVGTIAGIFGLLSIFISCLGLFGLAAYTAERRTKEIGIRKVLGASVAGITSLLAKDFLKLVLIAIVIASPIAYYFMQKWLSDFAYRIDIQWWIFVVAGVIAVLIACLTVGFQSVRAALMNPAKSLKSE
jgi:putative ABC transport system permease protein